jgi:hypothetical protein
MMTARSESRRRRGRVVEKERMERKRRRKGMRSGDVVKVRGEREGKGRVAGTARTLPR